MSEQPPPTPNPVLPGASESPEEKALREWWAQQRLASVEKLEEAARQLIGLAGTLLTLLFGVLALSGSALPTLLAGRGVRLLGVAAAVLLFAALAFALAVFYPRYTEYTVNDPDAQAAEFKALLAFKSRWLTAAVGAFGLGMAGILVLVLVVLLRV